jgi:hypothetical protein
MLSNKRAEKAIVDRANRTQNSTHAAQQRWSAQGQKDQQNQRDDDAGAMPPQCVADASQKPEPEPDISKNRDTNVSLALSAPEPASPLAEAVTIYNDTASRVGWPKMQKLTPARSQALRGRLRDCGGIDGWQIAMGKAEASDFLCGRSPKSWTGCGFDWITKQANFTKLMEGNYDNRNNNTPSGAMAGKPQAQRSAKGTGIVGAVARRQLFGEA